MTILILISILLVLVLINLIVLLFVGIILVRVLESVIEIGRTKNSVARTSKTGSGLPPGLVDVGASDTHDF